MQYKEARQVTSPGMYVSGLPEQPNREQDRLTTGSDSSPQAGADSGLAEAHSDHHRIHAARLQTRRHAARLRTRSQYQAEQSQPPLSGSQVGTVIIRGYCYHFISSSVVRHLKRNSEGRALGCRSVLWLFFCVFIFISPLSQISVSTLSSKRRGIWLNKFMKRRTYYLL